jgi:hypothetical protein
MNQAVSRTDAFDVMRFERQLLMTRWAKVILVGLFVTGWIGSLVPGWGSQPWPLGLMGLAVLGWVIANIRSNQTARMAWRAAAMTSEQAPLDHVESALDGALRRFTLYRGIRLMLYQHLAIVRHRQGRYDEASFICMSILRQPNLHRMNGLRSRLLLILAESRLRRRDLWGAYAALSWLHQTRLTLIESLQFLRLELAYEVLCGHADAALHQLHLKVTLASLMPSDGAGEIYRLLAQAASMRGWEDAADWLTQRRALLTGSSESDESPSASYDAVFGVDPTLS